VSNVMLEWFCTTWSNLCRVIFVKDQSVLIIVQNTGLVGFAQKCCIPDISNVASVTNITTCHVFQIQKELWDECV